MKIIEQNFEPDDFYMEWSSSASESSSLLERKSLKKLKDKQSQTENSELISQGPDGIHQAEDQRHQQYRQNVSFVQTEESQPNFTLQGNDDVVDSHNRMKHFTS